ncbi:MAG: SDR family oxidoreductase [Armatimonadetes bacterium]|nr:SDR family oxidoreductase [Armatimonadota bacterium]MDW8028487.1 SDR family NAD(P)-dependent oxidoreductase [Armatimonadota bacterium]
MRLKDKVAIVTGAARGIGKGIAIKFAQEGAKVVVNDINDEGGQRTVDEISQKGGTAIYCHADVTDSEQVEGMMKTTVENFGGLDILVCNAVCATQDILADNLDANLKVNVQGTYLCCQHAIPAMKARGSGSIVIISSVNALLGMQGIHAYSASKAALIGMARSLAVWHGRDQIRVNVICPGTIQTEIWEPILKEQPQIWDEMVRWYPIGRLGRVEDVANMALFLASEESSFVTGAVFVVDGGLTAGLLEFGKLR